MLNLEARASAISFALMHWRLRASRPPRLSRCLHWLWVKETVVQDGAARKGSLLLTMALFVAACGGISDATAEFCDSYVGLDQLLSVGPDEADPEPWVMEVTTSIGEIKEQAPAAIEDEVERMADSLLGPIQALDEEAFFSVQSSDDFISDSGVVNEFMLGECGFSVVAVEAIDYAYDADLEGIEEGTVAFDFVNNGSEVHEMVLLRINDDVTETLEELLELPEEEAETKTSFVGFSFASQGEGDVLFADLEAGRYAILCFLPLGSLDVESLESGAADGPPHFTQGMHQEFTIEG